ncbi:MAG: single-stranded-DNA-specific exonuclease RecJ [Clostridiales bacterium]|jgi:single-stranded-DNA-specific exonuclease|nr:single-stranded-DNA-specific exonuclease RecJ [Clostridiales bacterium]
MAKWILKKNSGDAARFAAQLDISENLSRILINRDIRTLDAARKYLKPDTSFFEPITNMEGVKTAYEIIKDALSVRRKIVIYGDYDVDGVMSTVILHKALTRLGADVSYYIPDREAEGYGLNVAAAESLHGEGCKLLICCDNGIASVAEIARVKELGMDAIIIDHHEQGDVVPKADAAIDPKQKTCPYNFKQMCAAGLVYRFADGLFAFMGRENPDNEEFLMLSAIATFCDIVDLQGENRIIAKRGLEIINGEISNLGLKTLVKLRSLAGRIGEFDIGFIIGPCINATGRLDKANLAVELFLTDDSERAQFLAEKLVELNEQRKKMTSEAFETALENYRQSGKDSKVIVIYDNTIHESIAGIVAGRIKDKLNHPVIVLTDSSDLETAKGSARSIEGYNMFESLNACSDLLSRFGGHTMAAGMSIKKVNIPLLEEFLNKNCTLSDDSFTEKIVLDKQLELSEVTYTLAKELKVLAPFGKANKEPLFGTKSAVVEKVNVYPEKNTLRLTFKIPDSYRKITGICFGKIEEFQNIITEKFGSYTAEKILGGILRGIELKLDIVYYIEINEYNGNISVAMKLKDFRIGE